MSFINFNNRTAPEAGTYSARMIAEALYQVETKNINKIKSLVESIKEPLATAEALKMFENKLVALNALQTAAANAMPVNEGQFSWMTQDTGEQIGSERENRITVYMYDNEGNQYKEAKYDGYGEFGGMDYYELLARMNGYTEEDLEAVKGPFKELRQIGIDVAFDKLKTKDKGRKVLYPALVTDPRYNWKKHDFTQQAENDPDQSWYVEPEYDEYEDEYYESKTNEAKSIAKIQKEWAKVTAMMKDTVDKWKAAEGQEKEDLLTQLKTLTISKKKLEVELDDAVGLKDADAELVGEAYTEDDINTAYGFYGTINVKEDDKTTQQLFDRSVKDLMKDFKISEEAALAVLNSKMGRKAADQIIDGQSKTAVDALKDYYGKTLKKEMDKVIAANEGLNWDSLIEKVKNSAVTEAKFVKDFNRDVLKARTKEEVLELYPNAQFFIGKSDHFFGELDGNLFFKAYYTKAQKEFEIKSVYSEKGSNYVHLYNESVVTEAKYDKKKLLKLIKNQDDAEILVNGKWYIIYNPDNGNDENTEMWAADDYIYALDPDGEEYQIKYKDIEQFKESVEVNEAKIEVGTFVRYKKDKEFTGGKIVSIKSGKAEIHNWDGSTIELPIKDLEYVPSWNESAVTEAGANDPVLIAFRAAKMKREKELAKPKRKPLYGKQREKAEDDLWQISQDLKDLYADRGQMLIDMEQEAEAEGGPIADEYGGKLNKIEDQIQKLIAKRSKLEMRLAESFINEEEDYSDEMTYGQLERCIDYATMLRERYDGGFSFDPWMHSAVTTAKNELNSVFDAVDGGDGVVEKFELTEGVMSDIHQMAGEVKDEEEFVKQFFKQYGAKVKKNPESVEWVKSLYMDTVKESVVNEAKKLDRDEMMDWLDQTLSFTRTSEEFDGAKGGIWTSGENGEEWKGKVIYAYYSEDYKNRTFGVLNSWEKELNKRGWYSEWYDAGTVMIWPN